MRTAVIGNSHVLAIHSALQQRAPRPEGFDCYFVPGPWGTDLAHGSGGVGSCLLKNDPARDESDRGISLDQYDRFVIGAMGWWAARNVVIEGTPTHPLGYMACVDWGYLPERVVPTVKPVSHQVLRIALQEWISEQPTMRLARFVAAHFPARSVLLQPWPAPNRTLKSDPDWFVNRWYRDHGPDAWRGYFLAQHQAVRNIVSEMGSNVTLLDYPLPGPGNDGFMDAHWCDQDPFHGNHHYGELLLQQIDGHHE
jgi:hypothetical protein